MRTISSLLLSAALFTFTGGGLFLLADAPAVAQEAASANFGVAPQYDTTHV